MLSFLPFTRITHPRRSFAKLRSFHLPHTTTPGTLEERLAVSPSPALAVGVAATTTAGEPKKRTLTLRKLSLQILPKNGVIPMPPIFVLALCIVTSLLFIITLSCVFRGAHFEQPYFKSMLDDVAVSNPGIVLVGDNVDVDVDEPSITIRWSVLACGAEFMLQGSGGAHGSELCGLPASPVNIFLDGDETPVETYDPSDISYDRATGQRRSNPQIVQFDTDHTLDVHESRLYPFDTYFLSGSLRAASPTNVSIPIRRIATISTTSSFLIDTTDIDSFSQSSLNHNGTTDSNGTLDASQILEDPTRDFDMRVQRPTEARGITLLLFGVSWVLTHVAVGHVILARRIAEANRILKYLVSAGAILVALPQLRNSMPDAPGFDGVLIDTIGYFPQMIITALCVVNLLLIVIVRELNSIDRLPKSAHLPRSFQRTSTDSPRPRTPCKGHSASTELAYHEANRVMRHLRGEFVFPPLRGSIVFGPGQKANWKGNGGVATHRRIKTFAVAEA